MEENSSRSFHCPQAGPMSEPISHPVADVKSSEDQSASICHIQGPGATASRSEDNNDPSIYNHNTKNNIKAESEHVFLVLTSKSSVIPNYNGSAASSLSAMGSSVNGTRLPDQNNPRHGYPGTSNGPTSAIHTPFKNSSPSVSPPNAMPSAYSGNLAEYATSLTSTAPGDSGWDKLPHELQSMIIREATGDREIHFGVLRVNRRNIASYPHLSSRDHFPSCICIRETQFRECPCAKWDTAFADMKLNLGLLLASRQINEEATRQVFETDTFTFYGEATLAKFVQQYPIAAGKIQRLKLVLCPYYDKWDKYIITAAKFLTGLTHLTVAVDLEKNWRPHLLYHPEVFAPLYKITMNEIHVYVKTYDSEKPYGDKTYAEGLRDYILAQLTPATVANDPDNLALPRQRPLIVDEPVWISSGKPKKPVRKPKWPALEAWSMKGK